MSKLFNKEILVVDDSNMLLTVTTLYLTSCGYIVSQALNGQEGLDLIHGKLPEYFSVIVMDYHMPIMNGQEFVTSCRSLPSYNKIKIIMLSSESKQSINPTGIDRFLQKPVSMQTLQRTILDLTEEETIDLYVLGD